MAFEISVEDVPHLIRPLVESGQDDNDLKDAVTHAIHGLGFDTFVYVSLTSATDRSDSQVRAWGTPAEAYTKRYIERGYVTIDPLRRAALTSPMPVCWNLEDFAHDPILGEFLDDTAQFGLCCGFSMRVVSADPGTTNFFSVFSPARFVSKAQEASGLGNLWALGAYGHRLLRDTGIWVDRSKEQRRALSPRAVDCLTLVAHGATSLEIGRRLGISERTVNAHIQQAMSKLGAKSRQEAVAKALTEGIILY
jgi:DNA-binding CsgD family transcriptional regulator